jgi:hypothetical protein
LVSSGVEQSRPVQPADGALTIPAPAARRLTLAEAEELLASWHHPRPERWLSHKIDSGALDLDGDPPLLSGATLWWLLLGDECDKLYNQAWCALEKIRAADDEDEVMMIALDDFPSAVEQAWSLAPELAGEHLALLREYKEARYQDFLRQVGAGGDTELDERIDALEFWTENDALMSELRRTLYGLVGAQLERCRNARQPPSE